MNERLLKILQEVSQSRPDVWPVIEALAVVGLAAGRWRMTPHTPIVATGPHGAPVVRCGKCLEAERLEHAIAEAERLLEKVGGC